MTECVILAGGIGSRLKNLTKKIPKPLIKIKNFVFLDYLLWHVCRSGITKVYLLVSYKSQKFIDKYSKKKIFNTCIETIVEKKRRGTGGALYGIKQKIKNDFFLLNGDSFFNIDLDDFKKKSQENNQLISIALLKNKNYKSNKILSSLTLLKKKIVFSKKNLYMNSGVYFIKKKFLKTLKNKVLSLEKHILPELIKKGLVTGKIYSKKFFIDIGTKKNLLLAKKKLSSFNKNKAFLLDRDGVINEDRGYIYKRKDFKILKGVMEGIKYLNKKKYIVCVVTNQSGIGRGLYSENDLNKLHKHLQSKLNEVGAYIDNFYFCPFHETSGIGKYKKKSFFRKPNPGMLLQALKEFNICNKKSYMIGDKTSDEVASRRAGVKFYYKKNCSLKKQIIEIINNK
jgi:D-glycero-D-manno-heptose 1,7-bisphosphate phosphatase